MTDLNPPKTIGAVTRLAGAWRGLWSFTLKERISWARLPLAVLLLLILPALVYLTTRTKQEWRGRGAQVWQVANLAQEVDRASSRAKTPLEPEKREALRKIISEEFDRAAEKWNSSDKMEPDPENQASDIRACYGVVRSRGDAILEGAQRDRFHRVLDRRMENAIQQVKRGTWTRTEPFYHWLIDFYFFVILPLQCVKMTGSLIRDELQAGTLCFLTTRSVGRGQLILLMWLTRVLWAEIVLLLEALLLFAAGWLREIPSLGELLPLFLFVQFLAIPAWCALGAFFGMVSKRHVALAIVYGVVVELGIGKIPTNINQLSIMVHLKSLLANNAAVNAINQWPQHSTAVAVIAVLLAAALFAGLSALLFTYREYHVASEMKK